MKKLSIPLVNDVDIARNLSDNRALNSTSYPYLKNQLGDIEQAYADYSNNLGNVWNIPVPNISDQLSEALKKHYKNPPKDVNFLKNLRDSSPEVCPMCGSLAVPTTLDHLLPKEDYPTWSIFSKNLIPACSCNTFRGRVMKGSARSHARILHPYFDNCLSERLLTTSFEFPDDFRWIRAKVTYIDIHHPDIESIKFHTKSIIIKNKIDVWLRGQMSQLKERPANVIKGLPRSRPIDENRLVETLEDLLEGYDEQCGTPNNWNSILIHGLQHAVNIHDWIIDRHNQSLL